jgi:homoserine O-acetyltransferase
MVRAQERLMHFLGIARWHAIAGGCMGGFQALEWLRLFPEKVGRALLAGTSWRTSAHTIARNTVLRQALMNDPHWNRGDYYQGPRPESGPALAATIGVLIWFDPGHVEAKHGRRRLPQPSGARATERFAPEFEVEGFLSKVAAAAPAAFDTNSMLYLTKAMDLFDLTAHGDLESVFQNCRVPTLLVSIDSDWRYPASQGEQLVGHLRNAGCPAEHRVQKSTLGHGAFFLDCAGFSAVVGDYLGSVH